MVERDFDEHQYLNDDASQLRDVPGLIPDPTFTGAEELLIGASPGLEDLRKTIEKFLVADGSPGPKTLHQLTNDERARTAFIAYSDFAARFIRDLEKHTADINAKFPAGSLLPAGATPAQENSAREALAEFVTCLEFVAWENNWRNSRVAQSAEARGSGLGLRRPEKTRNLFTAASLKSFIQDGGDPQKQGLVKFVQEWREYDFIEKAGTTSFILDKLLTINTPNLKWQKKYRFKEAIQEALFATVVGSTLFLGSVVNKGYQKLIAERAIKKKIQQTITPTNIFNLVPDAATTAETENKTPPLRRYLAQAKALWPKLHPQETLQNPYPGFPAHIPDFDKTSWPRDTNNVLIPPPTPKVDTEFWKKLLKEFGNASSENAQTQALRDAVRDDKIIPPLETLSKSEQRTLRPTLVRLFACLKPEDLVDLTESARGRLLHIKHKFNLPQPNDYLFAEHGRFDPYPHQCMVDNMGVYVDRLVTRIKDKDPVATYLTLDKNALNALPDKEKEKLLKMMVHECAKSLGISPMPEVKYDSTTYKKLEYSSSDVYPPSKTFGSIAHTSQTIPAKITFGPGIFKAGARGALQLVAHETEHASQNNLRWRVDSTQTYSPKVSFLSRFRPKKKLPKHDKYRENVVQACLTTPYGFLFGNEAERRGYAAGLAAEIFAEKSKKVLNPNEEGILWKMDPASAGSSITLAFSQLLRDMVHVSAPDISMRRYFFAPVNDVNANAFTPVNADDACEAFEASRPAHSKNPQSPTALQLKESLKDSTHQNFYAFHAAMPQIYKKAQDTKDPACVQCRLVLTREYSEFPEPRVAEFSSMDSKTKSASIEKRLHSLGKDYPDSFTRLWTAKKFSEATGIPAEELLAKINSVPPAMPKTSPHAAAIELEGEMGINMPELAAQFGVSNDKPTQPAEKTLNAFLKLQEGNKDADKKDYGVMTTIFGLRSRMPGFTNVTVDNEHPAYEKAELLDRMITSAMVRRTDDTAPTVEQALKDFLEEKHKIQFATSGAAIDKAYLDKLAKLAQTYSNGMCNEVIIHVALAARGINRESSEGKKILSAIRSVPLSAKSSPIVKMMSRVKKSRTP